MANVMIVDDDTSARELLLTVLEHLGHDVHQAGDGSEALALALDAKMDLVIADLLMPTMDGFELVRRLREHPSYRDIPVVFYTATYLESEVRSLARACGVEHFISKPAEPEQIVSVVNTALGAAPRQLNPSAFENFHHEHVGVLLSKLTQKAVHAVPQLGAMINLTIELGSERDPHRLLSSFCGAARKIVGARYAYVGVLNGAGGWRHFCANGIERELEDRMGEDPPDEDQWKDLLVARHCRRLTGSPEELAAAGLPADHPRVTALLAVPIASPDRVYGWLCLTNKISASSFSDEDEGLSLILASQMGRIYENGSLYSEIKRHADSLEHEIAERRRAEAAARQSEQRFRSLVMDAQDSIFTLSTAGEITSLNPAFSAASGWSLDEWLGRSFEGLIHPDDLATAKGRFAQVRDGERPSLFELRVRTARGAYLVFELKVTPQFEHDRIVGLLGIARDVTERRRLEEQIRQAQKMESIGRLAGGVAHDFNNLLTVINGCTEVLLAPDCSPGQRESLLEDIRSAGTRAAALTRQLLAFSRQSVSVPSVVDLNRLLSDLASMLRRLIGEHIELHIRPALSAVRILIDPVHLEQVVINLVVNARDAMPEGGTLTLEASEVNFATPPATREGGLSPGVYARLAVTDDGAGMSEDVQARIFEPFFTTKELGRGTGLGLATVYGIVKQAHGHLRVTSELGRGTSFEIFLPRHATDDGSTGPAQSAAEPRTANQRILLVEDDDGIRRLLRMCLESLGHSVREARDGEEALRLALAPELRIDLLITDVVMPKLSGPKLVELLRAKRPALRVLFMSGYAGDDVFQKAVQHEGAVLMQKPFTMAALSKKIREALENG